MGATNTKKRVSKGQYEKALARLAENKKKTADIVTKSEKKIQAEMESRHNALGNMPAEMSEDEKTILAYADDHKEQLFAEGKTHDTGVGIKITLRLSPNKLVYNDGVTAEDLLAELQKKKLLTYIKTKESVDVNAIKNATDDKALQRALSKVGASVEQEETIKVE